MSKKIGVFIDIGDEKKKDDFSRKANWDKGSMTNVINEWIDAYLENDLLTKQDAVTLFATIFDKLLRAGEISADTYSVVSNIEEMVAHELQNMPTNEARKRYSILTGENIKLVGVILRQIRNEKGFTLREVADQIEKNTGQSYAWQNISRIETQTGTPRRETIEPILEVYGVSFQEIERRVKGEN